MENCNNRTILYGWKNWVYLSTFVIRNPKVSLPLEYNADFESPNPALCRTWKEQFWSHWFKEEGRTRSAAFCMYHFGFWMVVYGGCWCWFWDYVNSFVIQYQIQKLLTCKSLFIQCEKKLFIQALFFDSWTTLFCIQ